jgi:hypothetical protein
MLSWLRSRGRVASPNHADSLQGLDAFSSEGASESEPETAPMTDRMKLVVGALVAVIALQAYPSAVWVRSVLRGKVEPVAAAATPAPLPAPVSCEAAPATTGTAPTTAAAPPSTTPAAPAPAPAAAAPPAMVAGMLSVTAPVPLRVFLKGRVVGTTEAESTMLPQGTHELEFVNESVGFRAKRTVAIRAGATTQLRLDAPNGTLHVNAVPWAEVFIDGQRMGETPIGNLPVRIGSHELVFKHPDLGERRTTALVTLKEPTRISMDLRKK